MSSCGVAWWACDRHRAQTDETASLDCRCSELHCPARAGAISNKTPMDELIHKAVWRIRVFVFSRARPRRPRARRQARPPRRGGGAWRDDRKFDQNVSVLRRRPPSASRNKRSFVCMYCTGTAQMQNSCASRRVSGKGPRLSPPIHIAWHGGHGSALQAASTPTRRTRNEPNHCSNPTV